MGNGGKSKGKQQKGKGKGKGDSRTGNTDRLPKSYYFDDYPDAAKGQKWFKCPKQGCFGCVLESSTTTHCKYCESKGIESKFNRSNSRSKSPSAGSSKSDQSNVSTDGQAMFKKLVEEEGISEDKAISLLATVGIRYKPSKPAKSNEIVDKQLKCDKVRGEIKNLQNLLSQQETKFNNASKTCDDALTRIEELETEISEKNKEIVQLDEQCALHLGPKRVIQTSAACIPGTLSEELQLIGQMSDAITEQFTDTDKANWMQTNFINMIQTTRVNAEAQQNIIEKLQTNNEDLARRLINLESKSSGSLAATQPAVPRIEAKSKAPPPPVGQGKGHASPAPAISSAVVPFTSSTEQRVARNILQSSQSSKGPDVDAGTDPRDDAPPEEWSESPELDFSEDTSMKKHGASTAEEANLSIGEECRAKRAKQQSRFAHSTAFERLSTGQDDQAEEDDI